MPKDMMDRRLFLTGLVAIAFATPGFAQHSDAGDTEHSSAKGKGRGAAGGQHGRPADGGHSGEDGDDHGDDHTSDEGHDTDEGHDSDHASGGKGKGPKYRGGRESVSFGVGHGRSLEDRVLKTPSF